jgi:TonB family protein
MSKLDNAAGKLAQMMARSLVHLCLLGGIMAGSLYASEAVAQAIEPVAPLQSHFTADDYPADAVAKGEQGTVEFLLSIAVDGQPTDCVVTNSSGSSSLDSATCLVMMERARFRPARNAAGKPAISSYRSRITWRLEDTGPGQSRSPAVKTATSLWFACSWGETAKLVTSELTAAEVATRALTACAPLEERSAVEMRKASEVALDPVKMIPAMKKEMAKTLAGEVDRSRAGLRGEGVE